MTKTRKERETWYGGDRPELIKMCLECKRSDCQNCIALMTREEIREITKEEKAPKRRKKLKKKHNTGGKA